MECSESLKDFVKGSRSFIGFEFNGLYTMDSNNFLKMFSHYIETGENYLDEYSEMTWLSWGNSSGCPLSHNDLGFEYFSEDERSKIKNWFNGNSFWDFTTFISAERKKEIEESLISSETYDTNKETYQYRREKASRHIANQKVRKRIFKEHGQVCAICGSKTNITIDHIIPVVKGGGNGDGNLRPLCKNCNSSKGGR